MGLEFRFFGWESWHGRDNGNYYNGLNSPAYIGTNIRIRKNP